MSYKALYRAYRPNSFDEVAGQKHIVTTLQNAVLKNKIAHAYLFCGPRGTGKTSIAKLLAKAVNCNDKSKIPCCSCENCLLIQKGNHPDIIEIDAASNNGVDEIRDLIEKVKYAPIQAKYKVYIIDEVHMLSSGAFNALLKTLEEPPAHVIFILATTEPHKVIPTIISRCQRYDFTKIDEVSIVEKMIEILNIEKIEFEKKALELIAVLADGGLRDALSILDQCIAYNQDLISVDCVSQIYGITSTKEKIELINYIFNKDVKKIIVNLKQLSESGIDIKRLTADLIEIIKETLIYSYSKDEGLLNKVNAGEAKALLKLASKKDLIVIVDILMETLEKYRNASNVLSYFEVALLKIMTNVDKDEEHIKPQVNDNNITVIKNVIEQPNNMHNIIESTNKNNEQINHSNNNLEIKPKNEKEEVLIEEVNITVEKKELEENSDNDIKIPTSKEDNSSENIVLEKIVEVVSINNIPKEIIYLTNEEILSLLVQGNKNIRMSDAIIINDYIDINNQFRKQINHLNNSSVVASGEKFILISANYLALANEMLSIKNELESYLWHELGIVKKLFIIDEDSKNKAINEFKIRCKENNLPKPMELDSVIIVKEAQEDIVEVKSTIEQIKDILGNDVKII